MKQSLVRLAEFYKPSIRFVGGPHKFPAEVQPNLPHPCTPDTNLLPGSDLCLPASEYLSKVKPFVVVPYRNSQVGTSLTERYKFVDRSLKDNEVASVNDLPLKFHLKPIEESEIDLINSGGAY
ncbi:hypothetical protein KAFR_0J00140 [Kazachstania africana CBS 2517]|uniref:Uncharacterized protein n=1 Tax=Kazachstania africana (strain ATCC 22294 / BCRC 22015 / CBS 2517 / CECT 1963 / NBRC 1671 / NRRL Y-8276) TaxID=1071382 RepID=H2B0D2_KAZAF|nr:hypothetical protein KAFR_0J00140 [Kazachstania africana CBS 2517]CCF60082.1 hypothetical protein KAFR_0J00140 [Kazachstania africana CBS 2517]